MVGILIAYFNSERSCAMFDLIQGKVDRPLHDGKTALAAVSILVHVTVIGLVLAVPFLYVTNQLPEVPAMMAFVTAPDASPAPPPPPPPPAPAVRPMQAPESTKSVPTPSPSVAPVEAPSEIKSEPPMTEVVTGAEGGIEGGVVGGVAGGVPGGLVGMPPPPPPPPAPPAGPVHIGGQVKAPALLRRIEPVYPDVAVLAKLTGVVVLEATVDTDGAVTSVRVLQSRGVLDKAAIGAVKQWQYTPLVLNGIPTSFVLTVTLNFALART
jgi:periplasmic protein TonB